MPRMQISLRKKIIFLVLSLLFVVTMAASIISSTELQTYYKDRIFNQMQVQLDEVEYLLSHRQFDFSNPEDYAYLTGYAEQSGHRLTLIDARGIVRFDSYVRLDSLADLENHLYRPEIQMAIESRLGQDQRISATLHQSMYYAAKAIGSEEAIEKIEFIRLALPVEEIQAVLNTVRWKIMGGGAMALILIAIVSYLIASRLTYPIHRLAKVANEIKQGNYDARFEQSGSDEIGELADLLNDMLAKLKNDLIRMKKLEHMRSQFLGNVSHELRTPIFSVQGYLETLMQNPNADAKKQQKFIKKAYRQAVRLNNLLTDLIDISRIESGEMKMTFSPFDVHEWLQKMVNDMRETAKENSVNIELENQENRHLKVLGDRARLNQVILNLVTNAIKYNVPDGFVKVGYVELGSRVEIYVSDSGRGIAQEHIPRIFERFYRVDKERSREVGGTGLGLAIVKHLVEAHNSKMKVESQPGVGARFSFTLRKG